MKKVAICGMAVLLVAFGVSMAFADPASFSNPTDNGATANSQSGNATTGGGEKSATAGVGDVANQHSTLTSDTTSVDVQTGDILSGNTKTTTIDKSGQTNTDIDTKTIKSFNTITKTDSDTRNDIDQKAKNGSAAAVNGNASVTKVDDSGNTKTITKTDLDQNTKNGSAASFSGDATVNKDSGNTTTIDKSGQTNKKNIANDNYASAVAQDGSTATSTYTKTTTIDKSGQTNVEKAKVENEAGAQNVGNGNTATSTYSKTTTIDKSGQNNAKIIAKNGSAASQTGNAVAKSYNTEDSYNIDIDQKVKNGGVASVYGNATKDSFNTKTITKDSNNTVGSFNTIYAVDDQVLVNNNSGASGSGAALNGQSLTVTKNWTSSNNGSFNNINGVINNNNVAGNFNNSTASTNFSLTGGVANHTP